MTLDFYVTQQGIVAALTDPRVLAQLRRAVRTHQAPSRLRRNGWIRPRVVSSKRRRRSLVRYAVTARTSPSLGPSLHQVHEVLRHTRRGLTTPELASKLPHMEVNTLRWAVQVLRQAHLAKTLPPL